MKSEEDNVFDIDCGIAGTRAVLPKSALGADPPPLGEKQRTIVILHVHYYVYTAILEAIFSD